MEMPNITKEVRELIADKVVNGEQIKVPWVTQEVLDRHSDIEGEDAGFYLICARAHIKDIVRSTIGKYDAKEPSSDRQLVLAGFEHLQIAYTVERQGEVTLVPVEQLTDKELLDRATEYDEMAKSCRAHAREIRKYVEARGAESAAA